MRSVLAHVPLEAAVVLEELEAIPRPARGGWWARRTRRARVLPHLLQLDLLAVPAACPTLLAWVTDHDRRIRERAARAFVACASARPAAVALALEALDSPLGGYGDASGSVDDAGSYGWVAHCLSRDGYSRERALRRLAALENPQPLAFVLVRLNDWVPQVRRAALEAARVLLAPRFARAWVLAWPAMEHLEACGRVDREAFEELAGDARQMLAAAWNGGAIEEGMRSSDTLVRRAAWRLALESAPAGASRELLLDALAADDVVVARRAAALGGRLADPDANAEFLVRRLAHHDPYVRRLALHDHPTDDPAELERALESRLLDRHGGVRTAAAFLWRKRLDRDPAVFYRERLAATDPRVIEAALLGLAAEGSAPDAERAAPWLDAAAPRLRAAAVDLATRATDPLPVLRSALLDPSRHVRDVARRRLRNDRDRLDAALLLPALDPALAPGPGALAMALADRAGRWEALAVALPALDHPQRRVADRARRVAGRALEFPGGGISTPSASQRARLEELLSTLPPDPLVDAARAQLLRTES